MNYGVLSGVTVGLQLFHVVFLWFHDWVPIGRLNDVRAPKGQDSRRRMIAVTFIQSMPYTLGLFFSIHHLHDSWVHAYLLTVYIMLFAGELRAWWVPYFWLEEPARAGRYKALFGNTHAFLPPRHGIRPNTLHFALHLATLATILLLIFT